MKHIRLFIAASALLMGLGGLVPAVASADTPQSVVCSTLQAGSDCSATPPNSTSLNKVIAVVVNLLSLVVGIAAVIMIIVGGFNYVTSGGDTNKTTAAKNTILYAVVGLVVVALAQTIVRFVLQKVK